MIKLRRARPLLGTLVEIQAEAEFDQASLLAAIDTAFAAVARVHQTMSVHEPDSEASRLNRRAHLEPVAVSIDLLTVLRAALEISTDSDGAFDLVVGGRLTALGLLPATDAIADSAADWHDISIDDQGQVRFRRPLRLDFGGIAKGYAVDCAIKVLRAAGVTTALVNAGGDLRVIGAVSQTIALRDPRDPTRLSQRLELCDLALATSASYYAAEPSRSALIEPRSGQPYAGSDSVSIIAPTCMTADALTKVALFADAKTLEAMLARHQAQLLIQRIDPAASGPQQQTRKLAGEQPVIKVTHRGGCHCGAVRFEVQAPARVLVQTCNCSMCRPSGYLHLIVPSADFRLLSGADQLTDYRFNTGVAQHLFCKVCGIKSFYVPRSNPDGYSVNLNCLDEGTLEGYELEAFDGQNWEQHGATLAHLSR